MIRETFGSVRTKGLRDNRMSDPEGTLSAMFDGLPADLRDLAEHQDGVLTANQLVAAGISREFVKSRLSQGRWQRLHRGVYATFSGQPGRTAVLWAAVLRAGPGAMLSHQTAAELWRLSGQSELVHVTVPASRRISAGPGIVVHHSSRAGEAVHPALEPPRTRVEETVLDLVSVASCVDDACGWLTRGLGGRLTTQDKLRLALEQRNRMKWRGAVADLLTADAAGLHSVLERRYHRDVERPHRLPEGTRQAKVSRSSRNEYLDVLYEAYATAVELDGNSSHDGKTRWRDIGRDNAAAADGIVTLRYGWMHVTHAPCRVAAQVVQVLVGHGYFGATACSPRCPVGRVNRRTPA